jgi:hypothetical protein
LKELYPSIRVGDEFIENFFSAISFISVIGSVLFSVPAFVLALLRRSCLQVSRF